MFQVPLVTSSTRMSSLAFWDAVNVYHSRPHLVNRRIVAVSQILFYRVYFSCKGIKHISELFTRPAILYEMRQLKALSKEYITDEFVRNIIDCFDKNLVMTKLDEKRFQDEHEGVFLSVRVLLPRSNNHEKCMEVAVLDKDQDIAIFLAVAEKNKVCLAPQFAYELELSCNSNLRVNIQNFEDADSVQAEWLVEKLFTKLLSWSDNYCAGNDTLKSLSLISVDEYCLKYSELKEKYGNDLIKEWPKKATTNPQKYVFEDIAIASYLICLWSEYPKNKIKFVDCGCGNGLLVYLLNGEGFTGYGIDIRRRPIWDIYPETVKLEVGTVTPSSLFPDSTWLLGNHSDELTPWLPVIALKSSPHTNYFVLPCCPYDFSGRKYIRTNTAISQYSDYMKYIREISVKCNFKTQIDKLRIPSTKRTCLIGITDGKEQRDKVIDEIDKYIASRMPVNFTPRSNVEQVRNCTQLEKHLIERLVKACVNELLAHSKNFIPKKNGDSWNLGTCLRLADLSRKLPAQDLKQLKRECGGLQTLLRNHRYIFEIQSGCVNLREPLKYDDCTRRYKGKPCWFLRHHPNGCLFDGEECAYSHDL